MINLLKTRPPLIALLCLFAGLAADTLAPEGPPVSRIFQALGVLPIGLGIRLMIWAVQAFEGAGIANEPEGTPKILITGGPMRISRHPFYLGMALIMAGIGWLLVSAAVMISGFAFALIVQMYFIPHEEETLERLFGDEYRDYRSRVRMWL